MKKWLSQKSLFSNIKALFLISSIAAVNASIGVFGIYWLNFGGEFAYEGGYFIALSTYISVIFFPAFVFYFIWPKPIKNRVSLAFASLPYIAMIICALSFNFYY